MAPIGQFQCVSDSWTPTGREQDSLNIVARCLGNNCESRERSAFDEIASHWEDDVAVNRIKKLGAFGGEGGSVTEWASSDLLTIYKVHPSGTEDDVDKPAFAIRTRCNKIHDSNSVEKNAGTVSCNNQEFSPLQNEALAKEWDGLIAQNQFAIATKHFYAAAKLIFADGDQSWRLQAPNEAAEYLLRLQAKRWKIHPETDLQFGQCADRSYNMSETGQIMDCSWGTRDGLQYFEVRLLKYNGADIAPDDRSLPWVVSSISVEVCEVR